MLRRAQKRPAGSAFGGSPDCVLLLDPYEGRAKLYCNTKRRSVQFCSLSGGVYLPSVAQQAIRSVFWLLSNGVHLWASNAAAISAWASSTLGRLDRNWPPYRSQTLRYGGWIISKIRSFPFSMNQVNARSRHLWILKRQQYRIGRRRAIMLSKLLPQPGDPRSRQSNYPKTFSPADLRIVSQHSRCF